MASNTIVLSDCHSHGRLLEPCKPIILQDRVVLSDHARPSVENYEFHRCDFDNIDIDGVYFSDCIFRDCSFNKTSLLNTYFWSGQFINCTFGHASWVHVGLSEVQLHDCIFSEIALEAGTFIGCNFRNITWNRGSITCSYFEYCKMATTSFSEAVVDSTFRDCEICPGAFDHLVARESSVSILQSAPNKCHGGEGSSEATEINHASKPSVAAPAGSVLVSPAVQTHYADGHQDPLHKFEVAFKRPTRDQLHKLDDLLQSETSERPFQIFLEQNPELLTLGVELGHHGLYVLSEVPFGTKYRADFMIGAKNSMGCFWTGLEIESPSHKVLKKDGHFTQKVQHAINQVAEWRNFVRTNRVTLQRPRSQHGEGLIGIEPDFKAWVIVGRDRQNLSAEARRARFLESTRNVQVQTWDGFRARVAAAVQD